MWKNIDNNGFQAHIIRAIKFKTLKRKSTAKAVLFLLERCVPKAERDAHCVRDAGFTRDAHFGA